MDPEAIPLELNSIVFGLAHSAPMRSRIGNGVMVATCGKTNTRTGQTGFSTPMARYDAKVMCNHAQIALIVASDALMPPYLVCYCPRGTVSSSTSALFTVGIPPYLFSFNDFVSF